MSFKKLNIPPTIHAGFVNRNDTYTGKLAYVIYTDHKGKLRKEKSWNGWRNQKIKSVDFENEPTAGFVLNRKVGGGNYGWHSRQAKIRIYDPRDFEFEITLENLLFILEECSSIKGKGLEGEFVYAWDRDKIVLLPVSSQEYKSSSEHTANQTKKVTKDSMAEGCMYRTKKGFEVMYLGRHSWVYETKVYKDFPRPEADIKKDQDRKDKEIAKAKKTYGKQWKRYARYSVVEPKKTESRQVILTHKDKKHIFVSLDGEFKVYGPDHRDGYNNQTSYFVQSGYTALSERLNDEPDPRFADEYEKMMGCKYITGKRSKPRKKKPVKKKAKKKAVKKKAKKKKKTSSSAMAW